MADVIGVSWMSMGTTLAVFRRMPSFDITRIAEWSVDSSQSFQHAIKLMVVVPSNTVDSLLDSIRSELGQPVAECHHLEGEPWHAQPPDSTIILRDAERLTVTQQNQLFDWLTGEGRSRSVVTVSSVSLWPLVERGAFRADLFYRLNVMTLSVGVAAL
jgi:hypothetical protein